MSPAARGRLGRAEAIIPRVAERVLGIEADGNMNGRIFEERFASKVVRMMVMMMFRTGHVECGMLERNVLAGDGFCGMRSA